MASTTRLHFINKNKSAKMRQSALMLAIRHFFKTTTLHGFKYLYSEYYVDRVGWLLCFCASACCAGVLCAVLWARFLEVPALLALRDLRADSALYHRMPLVAVCPSVEGAAETIVEHLTTNTSQMKSLPFTLSRVLNGRIVAEEQLKILDELLATNNLTLPEALLNFVPPCPEVMRKCRWQNTMVPCNELFQAELTPWGVCCIMRPDKVFNASTMSFRLDTTRRLDLAAQCSNGSTVYGCAFFTKYDGEEWVKPDLLKPGYLNVAQLKFSSILDSRVEKLVDGSCVSGNEYSRRRCLVNCAETSCGCSNPLQMPTAMENLNNLPPCSVRGVGCLKAFGYKNNISCHCLPACRKVTSYLTIESSKINAIKYTYDPIYVGLNTTSAVVIHIGVNIALSRTFYLNPTETWLTLLSSLGGVFNMFLGVGLFSALEILFLLLIKLPLAIRRSSEIENQSTVTRH